MTQNLEISKAKINIGEIIIDCYQDQKGQYYLSQNQTTNIISVDDQTTERKRQSKELKALLGNDFSTEKITFTNSQQGHTTVNLISTKYVPIIWSYFAFKGNKLAQTLIMALAFETLERKADLAFNITKTEIHYSQQTQEFISELTLKQVRDNARLAHGGFQKTCELYRYPARHVHDLATKILVGRTASDSINSLPVNSEFMELNTYTNPDIGINHVKKSELGFLEILSKFKTMFASKRPKNQENWETYTQRVIASLEN